MKLGLVSAILPELSLSEVGQVAKETGYDSVELMCWPVGKAERRYAGVTHLDVSTIDTPSLLAARKGIEEQGISISALGYYPNLLTPNPEEAEVSLAHLQKVIEASSIIGVNAVNTFVGRDWTRSLSENWPKFLEVWTPLIQFAERKQVKIGIENCPMYFTSDEWPGGKNLATHPAIWRRMFEAIPSPFFGLNYDPSHLIWQMMDTVSPIDQFADRIVHFHAKDALIHRDRLNEVGIMATPLEFHSPVIPGRGEVPWVKVFAALRRVGYDGHVVVEVEDRDFEGTLEDRKEALRRSADFLRPLLENP